MTEAQAHDAQVAAREAAHPGQVQAEREGAPEVAGKTDPDAGPAAAQGAVGEDRAVA